MSSETLISIVALVVSLVALSTTIGQLLQQYFATADGYRRCHKSVMGEYGKKTRLHWRWREFRFETIYTTPEIFLVGHGSPSRVGQVLLTDTKVSREKSLVPDDIVAFDEILPGHHNQMSPHHDELGKVGGKKTRKSSQRTMTYRGEQASWVPLLHWLHQKSGESLSPLEKSEDPEGHVPFDRRLPAVIFRERSWDFHPPDIVRPLAKTTLSDIAIIARRMGMKWKDFRPSDGVLRAEGHSQIITSTMDRSIGIVLQYAYTGQGKRLRMSQFNLRRPTVRVTILAEQEEIYIPSAKADRLGCGVLRTEDLLGLPDLIISTQKEIVKALGILDRSGFSSTTLSKILTSDPDYVFRIGDLVALTTSTARCYGSNLVQVPAPSDNVNGVSTLR